MTDFQEQSFYATVAFGIAALIGLLLAGLWANSPQSVNAALCALAAAYAAQHLFTVAVGLAQPRAGYTLAVGLGLQLLACLAFLWGVHALWR